jgi:uncharacterized membrane protein YbhN (UPF0104 family)
VRLKIAVVLAITVACLGWVLWGIDIDQVAVSLGSARWIWMLPMLCIYLCAHGLRSLRLGLLLGESVPFAGLFSVTSIGYLAINVVPLRLGEFVRPYLLLESHQIPFGTSLAAILVERLLDLMMLLGMLLLVGWAVELPAEGVMVGGLDVITAGQRFTGTLSAVGFAGILALLVAGPLVLDVMARVPGIRGLLGLATAFHGGLRRLIANPARGVQALLLSVVIWSITVVAVTCVLRAFDGLPHSLAAGLTTWSITLSGMTIAPTPGFFGAYEAFCLAALMLWGVDQAIGATFAIVMHLGQFVFTIVMGGLFVVLEGLSLSTLVADSRRAAQS